jgi:hypothetical protein
MLHGLLDPKYSREIILLALQILMGILSGRIKNSDKKNILLIVKRIQN